MRRIIKKVTALVSVLTLTFAFSTVVFADTQNATHSGDTANVELTGSETESFIVGIPTAITITNDAENRVAKSAPFNITIQGAIDANKQLSVVPSIAAENKFKRAGDNHTIELNILNGAGTAAPQTAFTSAQVPVSSPVSVSYMLESNENDMMRSGSYSGTLTYTITLAEVTP